MDIKEKLNFETARISWSELQRHFARGVVLKVARGFDLLEAAESIACDDVKRISDWMEKGVLCAATIDDARFWNREQSTLWAVVVAPWVLVQNDVDCK